jgi:hypothetical protein
MKKYIETFLSSALCTLLGLLAGAFISNHMLLISVCGGIGAVIGSSLPTRIYFHPKLRSNSYKVWTKIGTMLILLSIVIWAIIYMTYDFYQEGQILYTTTRVQVKNKPGVTEGNRCYPIKTLDKGERVIYLKKMWRRIRWKESGKSYFHFWRKIRTEQGIEGWVYGAYLKPAGD